LLSVHGGDRLLLFIGMNTAKQFNLFEKQFPRSLECSGPDLPALLADLKTRGCIVLGMTVVKTGRWLLSLQWPTRHPAMVERPTPGPTRYLPAGTL
jgi:hypothetical protein